MTKVAALIDLGHHRIEVGRASVGGGTDNSTPRGERFSVRQ